MNFSADLYLDYNDAWVFFVFFPKITYVFNFSFLHLLCNLTQDSFALFQHLSRNTKSTVVHTFFPKWVTAYPMQHKYDAAVFRE